MTLRVPFRSWAAWPLVLTPVLGACTWPGTGLGSQYIDVTFPPAVIRSASGTTTASVRVVQDQPTCVTFSLKASQMYGTGLLVTITPDTLAPNDRLATVQVTATTRAVPGPFKVLVQARCDQTVLERVLDVTYAP